MTADHWVSVLKQSIFESCQVKLRLKMRRQAVAIYLNLKKIGNQTTLLVQKGFKNKQQINFSPN